MTTPASSSGAARVTPYLRSGFCAAAAALMLLALGADVIRRSRSQAAAPAT